LPGTVTSSWYFEKSSVMHRINFLPDGIIFRGPNLKCNLALMRGPLTLNQDSSMEKTCQLNYTKDYKHVITWLNKQHTIIQKKHRQIYRRAWQKIKIKNIRGRRKSVTKSQRLQIEK
jgi:hypothetical protein